jgi:hypothetical protein
MQLNEDSRLTQLLSATSLPVALMSANRQAFPQQGCADEEYRMARQTGSSADKPESEPAKGKPALAKPAVSEAKPHKASAESAAKPVQKPAGKKAPEKKPGAEISAAESEPPLRREPDEEVIRVRAYAIWIEEGMPHGRDEDHWRRALRELDEDAGLG